MLDLFLLFLMLGTFAFAWCRILPADGHVLAPIQRAWRKWYRSRYGTELDEAWFWRPLWGCAGCCAGQLSFWTYLIRFHATYDPLLHLCATGLAITTACYLTITWNRSN